MYRSDAETWRGFGKNTHEGLGAPTRIGPFTLILGLGQVAPFALLPFTPWLSGWQIAGIFIAIVAALLPRVVAARRFGQPFRAVWLHPLGVASLLALQWWGLVRYLRGRPSSWKGRSYLSAPTAA